MATSDSYKYPYYVSSSFLQLVEKLQIFFSSPDPSVVISPPHNGTHFRVRQIMQNYKERFACPLVAVDLDVGMDDIKNIEEYILSLGYTLGKDNLNILITNAKHCLISKNFSLISELVALQRSSARTHIVFFFESNIHAEENIKILRAKTIYSQIYYYPMFDEEEARKYLEYLVGIWQMKKVPKTVINRIARECSGQIWLLTQAFRDYRNDPKTDLDSLIDLPGLRFRVDIIAKSFNEDELAVLTGNSNHNQTVTKYLSSIGLLKSGHCCIPILLKYLQNNTSKMHLTLSDGDIHLNKINLRHSFTSQENQVLKKLLDKPGHIISRDEIAEVIWRREAEEKYSEWAIEQLIKRLRRKLHDIGLHDDCIKTCRGEGYKID